MDTMTKDMTSLNEFVTYRVFNASVKKVWQAWTERDRLMQWFSPEGYLMVQAKLDLRPGGAFHYALRGSDGKDMWGKWLFREIVPEQKLVLVSSFSNAKGGITRHPMAPNWPLQTVSTTTFLEQEGKTKITLRWTPLDASELEFKTFAEGQNSMKEGWNGTFAQLAAYLNH